MELSQVKVETIPCSLFLDVYEQVVMTEIN